ncbi:MAG: prepilin peptidase [Alphaproteobacteria bacterium]|nr:prepilin peptidase [Alphaproteobacteria bacterium]
MFLLTFFLICVFIALGAGFLAALSDLKGLKIPNFHSVLIAGTFLMAYAGLWLGGREDVFAPLLSHMLGFALVFLMTLALFAFRAIGGGDSKMASAFALWMGLKGIILFLFYTAMFGGLLGAAALILKRWKPFKGPAPNSWIARVQAGENAVPYGVAILAGALVSFAKIGYFGSEVLSSFLLS